MFFFLTAAIITSIPPSLKTACPQTEHSKKNSHIELINYQLLTNDIKPNRNSEQNEATNVHFRFSDVP
jgi:hypothetical protein